MKDRIKRLLAAFALVGAFAGLVVLPTTAPPVSAASGCSSTGQDAQNQIGHARGSCNALNIYFSGGQNGEQFRVKIKCATGFAGAGTVEPNFRYGPWVALIGTTAPSGAQSDAYCDATYPHLSILPREIEMGTWTPSTQAPNGIWWAEAHNEGASPHGRAAANTDGQFGAAIQVLVQCGTGNPLRSGPPVTAVNTWSYYYCGTYAGDGPYATNVWYTFNYNY